MSMRTLLGLLLVFSTSLLAAPSLVEASDSKRSVASKRSSSANRFSTSKRFSSSGRCEPRTVRNCSLHRHEHVITAGMTYFNRGRACLRRLPCGTVQRWIPPSSKVVRCKVPGVPTFRTVTRYRTIWTCGIARRVPYRETIKIPGRDRIIHERVKVPGKWVPYKFSRRYGSQLSFLRYPPA
ncbi:MAG: hypothetical protein VX764_10635 [Planctomycetota bacterium]|nr:hypothetical protein [Planctomycetota bacterium]